METHLNKIEVHGSEENRRKRAEALIQPGLENDRKIRRHLVNLTRELSEGPSSRPPPGGSESRRWLEGLSLAQEVGRTGPGTRRRPGFRCVPAPRRSVIAGGGVVDLMEHVSGLPAVGTRTVHAAARGGITGSRGRKAVRARPARTAETEIRVARVELKAPGKSRRTLPVTAVPASGTTTPPKGGRRLSWPPLSSDARPALDPLDADELTALRVGPEDHGFRDARAPLFDGFTIRGAAIDIGRHLGFIPSKRQPLPGTRKMWKGMKYLLQATAFHRAFRSRGMLRESTVL